MSEMQARECNYWPTKSKTDQDTPSNTTPHGLKASREIFHLGLFSY